MGHNGPGVGHSSVKGQIVQVVQIESEYRYMVQVGLALAQLVGVNLLLGCISHTQGSLDKRLVQIDNEFILWVR